MLAREDEILLAPAREFQVISLLDAGNDLYMVHLKEIEPKWTLLELVSLSINLSPLTR